MARAKKEMAEVEESREIVIPPIRRARATFTIVGTTPLICGRIPEYVKRSLRDKDAGVVKSRKRTERDIVMEFNEACYRFPDGGYGFPAGGIKSAIADAALTIDKRYAEYTKIGIHRSLRIPASLLAIEGCDGPEMHEDTIRNRTTQALVLAYRPYFFPWHITFPVIWNEDEMPITALRGLIERAGHYIGIGVWRPDRKGEMGTFSVAPDIIVER